MLVAETPEISLSEGSYLLFKQQLHQIPHRDSVIAWAMQQIATHDQAVLFDFKDLMTHFPDYPQWEPMEALGYRDCLATSLRVGGELIGMFCINARRTEAFTHVDRLFFQAVADLIAVAVSNVLANEQLVREKQFKETLLGISEAVATVQDRVGLFKMVFDLLKPFFNFYDAGLFVLNNEKKWLEDLMVSHPEITPSEGVLKMHSDVNVNKKIEVDSAPMKKVFSLLKKGWCFRKYDTVSN